MDNSNKNEIVSGIILMGALVAILSVFMIWVFYDFGVGIGIDGTDIIEDSFDGSEKYMAIATCALGIIAFIVAIVGKYKPEYGKYMAIVDVVLGIVMIALIAYFMMWDVFSSGTYSPDIGYGVYIALIGSIIVLVGAACQTYISYKG